MHIYLLALACCCMLALAGPLAPIHGDLELNDSRKDDGALIPRGKVFQVLPLCVLSISQTWLVLHYRR